MDKKRIAIVGLGKIGLFHLSILKNFKEVEIVGLMDKETSVQKIVRGMGINVPFFDSVDTLVKEEKLDGIFACVPPAYNRSIAKTCITNGISLFLEKPITSKLTDAVEIVKLLKQQKSPPTNAVGYMVAYYPTFEYAQKLLKDQAIGQVRHYTASQFLEEVLKKHTGWRQNPAISGGGVVGVVGSHLLYLIQSFFGLPLRTQATTIKLFSEVEDICHARLEHADHLLGEFHVSWSRPGYSEVGYQIHVEGTKGFMEITENSLSLFAFENNSKFPIGWKVWYPWDFIESKPSKEHLDIGQQGYVAQDYDFVQSIGSGKLPRVSWTEGLKVQKMIEAIYRSSSNSNQPFELSELDPK